MQDFVLGLQGESVLVKHEGPLPILIAFIRL